MKIFHVQQKIKNKSQEPEIRAQKIILNTAPNIWNNIQKEKNMKNKEQQIQNVHDSVTKSNMYFTGVPQEKNKDGDAEII